MMIAILFDVRWYLTVVFICITLISDAEHLFIGLLAMCMSFLDEYLFRSSANFVFFLYRFFIVTIFPFLFYFIF